MAFRTNPACRLILQMKFYWKTAMLLHLLLYVAAFALQWHNCTAVTKTVWPTAENIYCLALPEKCAGPWSILLGSLTLESLKMFQSPGLVLGLNGYKQIPVFAPGCPAYFGKSVLICRGGTRPHNVNHVMLAM